MVTGDVFRHIRDNISLIPSHLAKIPHKITPKPAKLYLRKLRNSFDTGLIVYVFNSSTRNFVSF